MLVVLHLTYLPAEPRSPATVPFFNAYCEYFINAFCFAKLAAFCKLLSMKDVSNLTYKVQFRMLPLKAVVFVGNRQQGKF